MTTLTAQLKAATTEIKKIFKLAKIERQVLNGTVDKWITEVTGGLVEHKIDDSISHVAYLGDDDVIYIRLSSSELVELAGSNEPFKDLVQAIIAHEMGHFVDPDLQHRQTLIDSAINLNDGRSFNSLVLEREHAAWELGKQFSKNLSYYDKYNQLNLNLYHQLLRSNR